LSNFKNELTGCGPFLHNDPRHRPPAIFGDTSTLHFSGSRAAYVLVPIIPPKKQAGGKRRRNSGHTRGSVGVFLSGRAKVSSRQPSA
jgi:hypothetical protein